MPTQRKLFRFGFSPDYLTVLYLVSRAGILLYLEFGPHVWTDIDYYYEVASGMLSGQIPFKDFQFQYPPLSLLIIGAPAVIREFIGEQFFLSYATCFRLLMCAADGAVFWLVRGEARRCAGDGPAGPSRIGERRLVIYYIVSSSIFAYILFDRLDIVLGLLNFYALTAISGIKQSFRRAFVIGLGTLVKLVPIILLPVLIIEQRARKVRSKDILKTAAWALVPSALGFLLAYLLSPQRDLQFITYHKIRGIEVEATWSSLITVAHLLGIPPHIDLSVAYNVASYSNELKGEGLKELSRGINRIMILFLMGCGVLSYLRRRSPMQNRLCFFGAFILISFLISGKVFSPQYLIWVTPIMPFAFLELRGWKRTAAYASFLAACALTTVIYPFVMQGLVALRVLPIVLLAMRNSIIFFIWLLLAQRLISPSSTGAP